jgi:hypothetical protein
VSEWDWPGDDREGKAKRVALAYRELAFRIAAGQCPDPEAALGREDRFWLAREQHWIRPGVDPYDPDDWINANDAAHYTGVQPGTIRKWAELKRKGQDGIIERHGPDGKPRYNVGDIIRYGVRRRQRRMKLENANIT